MISLLAIALLAADPPPANSAPALMTEPGDIDDACDAAEKFAGEHESEGRIVADV